QEGFTPAACCASETPRSDNSLAFENESAIPHLEDDRLRVRKQFAAGNRTAPCGAGLLQRVITPAVVPNDARHSHTLWQLVPTAGSSLASGGVTSSEQLFFDLGQKIAEIAPPRKAFRHRVSAEDVEFEPRFCDFLAIDRKPLDGIGFFREW